MKYLRKVWIRILVSLFAGGLMQEIIFLSTGDPTRSRKNEGSGVTLVAAVIIYGLLTYLVRNDNPPRVDKLK
jgi:hypothetical protein